MERSKVYFTDFHTIAFGDGLPTKLKKLIKKAPPYPIIAKAICSIEEQ